MANITKLFLVTLVVLFCSAFLKQVNAQVVINEFSSATSTDWVELYAFEDTDISGWVLDDDGTNTSIYTFPSGTIIGPTNNKEFYLIDETKVSNRLNKNGDIITLYDNNNGIVDTIPYGNKGGVCVPEEGQTIGRVDNANTIERFSSGSKGLTNVGSTLAACPTPTPDPTITNTPTVTPKPTNTNTPTPTLKPISTPTEKPTFTPTPEVLSDEGEDSQVKGVASEEDTELNDTDSGNTKEIKKNNIPIVAGIFIVGGLGFISAAFYPFLKPLLKRYNLKIGKKRE